MANGEDGEPDLLVTPEVEAAEALAVLSRSSASDDGGWFHCSPVGRHRLPQDQTTALQCSSGCTSSLIISSERNDQNVGAVPNHSSNTILQSNPASRFRKNLTAAEKEAQKLRRILANRVSARETIHRRQAMHLALTKKAADLFEENESLKKEKELMEEEYDSLRSRNALLKAQMATLQKDTQGKMQEDPKFSQRDKSSKIPCATTSTESTVYNQLGGFPCFWPPDFLQIRCSDIINLSQFSILHGNVPCPHQGQENMSGSTGPTTPLILLPVPWLLPFIPHGCSVPPYSVTNDRQTESLDTCQTQSDILVPVNQDTVLETSVSKKHTPVENLRPIIRNSSTKSNVNAVSVIPKHGTHALPREKRKPVVCKEKRPMDVFAATEARKRRKELMRLKITH